MMLFQKDTVTSLNEFWEGTHCADTHLPMSEMSQHPQNTFTADFAQGISNPLGGRVPYEEHTSNGRASFP
jgi:hypothetical protein